MEIITDKDTDYEVMLNPVTTHSFQKSHPVESNTQTKQSHIYEEIEQSQSHYELVDEDPVKKGEDHYVPILDGPSLISSPPTTTNSTTDSFNKM